MKRILKSPKLAITLFFLICVVLVVINPYINPRLYFRQRELARSMDVEIWDYPYTYSFPSGYFYTILKPGMTIEEVHNVVIGYDIVSNCTVPSLGFMYERYIYYSDIANYAMVFRISYSLDGIFEDIVSFSNMSELPPENCEEGQFIIE